MLSLGTGFSRSTEYHKEFQKFFPLSVMQFLKFVPYLYSIFLLHYTYTLQFLHYKRPRHVVLSIYRIILQSKN
jgi:hypothetical protein